MFGKLKILDGNILIFMVFYKMEYNLNVIKYFFMFIIDIVRFLSKIDEKCYMIYKFNFFR